MSPRMALAAFSSTLLLSACGGGTSAPAPANIVAGLTAPAPVPVSADFIAMAQAASCTDTRNRLFIIDQSMVYWDRAGQCADNSAGRTLFGLTPQQTLCTAGDSIAGPVNRCGDDTYRALFDTIGRNPDLPDLGLGSGHKVEALSVMPTGGTPVSFAALNGDAIPAAPVFRTVVIHDAAAWSALWQGNLQTLGYTASGAAPAGAGIAPVTPPAVDFSKKMVVGVFYGGQAMCADIAIDQLRQAGNRLLVDYHATTAQVCAAVVRVPRQLVLVDRSDAPVEFANQGSGQLAAHFDVIASSQQSGMAQAKNVVVRDATAWNALWAAYAGPASNAVPAPAIDFSKYMVAGLFAGSKPQSCYTIGVGDVRDNAGQLTVRYSEAGPGPAKLCAAVVTAPAQLVLLPMASTDPVFVQGPAQD